MIDITWQGSNRAAKAAQVEIRAFLDFEERRIARDLPDRKDMATLGYVFLRSMLTKLDAHMRLIDEREPVRDHPVPIRQSRRLR